MLSMTLTLYVYFYATVVKRIVISNFFKGSSHMCIKVIKIVVLTYTGNIQHCH